MEGSTGVPAIGTADAVAGTQRCRYRPRPFGGRGPAASGGPKGMSNALRSRRSAKRAGPAGATRWHAGIRTDRPVRCLPAGHSGQCGPTGRADTGGQRPRATSVPAECSISVEGVAIFRRRAGGRTFSPASEKHNGRRPGEGGRPSVTEKCVWPPGGMRASPLPAALRRAGLSLRVEGPLSWSRWTGRPCRHPGWPSGRRCVRVPS